MKRSPFILAMLLLVRGSFSATAQPSYPDRPVKIVVPYAPGGGVDQIARMVALKLQQRTGQPVIVENRAGASTNIGTLAVVKAPADGYTLLLASTPLVVNPSLTPLPFNPRTDLVPISLLGTLPTLLVVHPSLPVNNVRDLIEHARAHPTALNYASVGAGSSTHVAAELFKQVAGIQMTHVPYKGSAPAYQDLLADRVQLMFSTEANRLQVNSSYPAYSEKKLWERIAQVRAEGYLMNQILEVHGARSIAVPIHAPYSSVAVAAISLSTVASRMHSGRARQLVDLLKAASENVVKDLERSDFGPGDGTAEIRPRVPCVGSLHAPRGSALLMRTRQGPSCL